MVSVESVSPACQTDLLPTPARTDAPTGFGTALMRENATGLVPDATGQAREYTFSNASSLRSLESDGGDTFAVGYLTQVNANGSATRLGYLQQAFTGELNNHQIAFNNIAALAWILPKRTQIGIAKPDPGKALR